MTKNDINIGEVLTEVSDVKQSKYNGGRFNKTSLFVLPMLNLSVKNREFSKYLKNVFLDDKGIEHDFVRPIFLLMKVKSFKERDWQNLYKALTDSPILANSYVMDYYIGQEDDHHLVMYVLRVADKWNEDFEHFKAGRYSKMSNDYKSMFPREVYLATGDKKESQIWGALHKSDNLKDSVTKEFINPATSKVEEVISFRRDMDSWEEIWDKPRDKEEVYRFKIEEQNAVTNIFEETPTQISSSWPNS